MGKSELLSDRVRIKRQGLLSIMPLGLQGDREILVSQISSIQFKTTGTFTNGYIRFAFLGGQEFKGGLGQATADENAVHLQQ